MLKKSFSDGNNYLDWERQMKMSLQYYHPWNIVKKNGKEWISASSSLSNSKYVTSSYREEISVCIFFIFNIEPYIAIKIRNHKPNRAQDFKNKMLAVKNKMANLKIFDILNIIVSNKS
jgi:hypothetical protein